MMRQRTIRRAFTLAETLVAIAVLGALVGSVFGFMRGLADRRETLERLTEDAAAGDSLLRNLEADIGSCVAGASGLGAGIAGDASSLRLLSRAGLIDPGGADGVGAELVRAEYTFDPAARSVTVSRRAARGAGGGSEQITRRAQLLRFRYLSGGVWQERFDSSEAGGLPVAIEVALWFGDEASAPAVAPDEAALDEALGEPPEVLEEPAPLPRGEPDRVRMFIVPDGPTGSWEGAQ